MQFDMYLESTKVTPLNARVSYMGTTFISALIPSFIYSWSIRLLNNKFHELSPSLAVTTHFCLTRGSKRWLVGTDWSAI